MSYSSYMPSSYHDNNVQIAINGVELVNRHELSNTQDKVLQRFIDANSHILQWKDREIIQPPVRHTPSHHYEDMRRSLSRGPSPFEKYNSLDRLATKRQENIPENPPINRNDLPRYPNIDNHNYTEEFPGLEYLSDNTFIEDLIKQGQVSIGSSGLISQPGSRVGSSLGGAYSSLPRAQSNMSNYGTLKGGIKQHSTLPPTSPYSSLKRKGVSWLDQERARSLSPGLHQNLSRQYQRPASTIHTTTYTTSY
ncbi:unnamed protein product [Caenorhabditis angaria]|uniref:Uncharacterized protein n=1 Tax=Caenorhabditis angaria TaxID=860376 RepID=A0A9P1NAK6_9PELO|nr:unnamed protein product [Caenorhabditis angaria]